MDDRLIDLRSDTVTRPSAAMRKAMAEAEVGDDVYREDPTVRRLEETIAVRLGTAAALFVTSATQANQIAIGAHCRPGDELIGDEGTHSIYFEAGAPAALWGVQVRALKTERGFFGGDQLAAAVRADDVHFPRSRLVIVENTHNLGGGGVWPRPLFAELAQRAHELGLKVHLDGARLFHAEVATGVPVKTLAQGADTVSLCFSKGLGAPVGSVLCGSRELIEEGRRLRKRLGGGMRQAGILAAACLYALEHNVSRLAEDHRNAQHLARKLAELPGVSLDPGRVETNLVYFDVPVPARQFVSAMRERRVLCNAVGASRVRMVCHLDVSAEQVETALQAARKVVGSA